MTIPLRQTLIRMAYTDSGLKPYLLPLLKTAKVFPTQKALDSYLDEHPNAKPSSHSVETKKKDKGPSKKDLDARKPKIDSEDLSAYPPDAEADDLSPEHQEEISDYKLSIVGTDARQAVEIARRIKEGIKKGADICKLNPAVCEENLGLTRDKMPQIEGEKSVKQMLASDNALDRKKGQAMVQAGADPESDKTVLQLMIDHLQTNGVKTSAQEVSVGELLATQAEIKAEKVYGMADSYLKGKFPSITDSVVVSRDGHILDGHHRWAALLTIDPAKKMKVKVIDMDMRDLLAEAQAVPGVYTADFEGEPLDEAAQKTYKGKAKSRFQGKKKGSLRSPNKEVSAMSNLRASVIRLAHQNPSMRKALLDILEIPKTGVHSTMDAPSNEADWVIWFEGLYGYKTLEILNQLNEKLNQRWRPRNDSYFVFGGGRYQSKYDLFKGLAKVRFGRITNFVLAYMDAQGYYPER